MPNTPTTEAVTFYKQHFGEIHPYMRSELEKWLSEAGDDLVMEAMKRAVDYHKLSWSYVKKILINWKKQEVTSVEEVRKEAEPIAQQQKKRQYRKNHSTRKDIVPDWFKERYHEEKQKSEQKSNVPKDLLTDIVAIASKYQNRKSALNVSTI
ncbi:DnaD domain-containing protein [Radiobacillus sp. PE A8.2]|uniref:DnaD domain-containing protein n=1 Tax=Radiobacillus sp. PE A8.2 TaxID=3380349 RepID=UPI0038903000